MGDPAAPIEARPAHWEVVQTDDEQPWRVRLMGANGEPIMLTGDHYADKRDAAHAVDLARRAETGYYIVDERKAKPS